METLAERRAQAARSKARAKRLLAIWRQAPTQHRVGRVARTRKPCSCWMCCNRRHVEGPPVRELRREE